MRAGDLCYVIPGWGIWTNPGLSSWDQRELAGRTQTGDVGLIVARYTNLALVVWAGDPRGVDVDGGVAPPAVIPGGLAARALDLHMPVGVWNDLAIGTNRLGCLATDDVVLVIAATGQHVLILWTGRMGWARLSGRRAM